MANIEMQNMSDHFGEVYISVENNAEIWFNGQQVGTGKWFTQLREGSYTIETRKSDCDPMRTNFRVEPKRYNQITAYPPSPHTGILNIFTRPRNVTALLNGMERIDLTQIAVLPAVFGSIGQRHLLCHLECCH